MTAYNRKFPYRGDTFSGCSRGSYRQIGSLMGNSRPYKVAHVVNKSDTSSRAIATKNDKLFVLFDA